MIGNDIGLIAHSIRIHTNTITQHIISCHKGSLIYEPLTCSFIITYLRQQQKGYHLYDISSQVQPYQMKLRYLDAKIVLSFLFELCILLIFCNEIFLHGYNEYYLEVVSRVCNLPMSKKFCNAL